MDTGLYFMPRRYEMTWFKPRRCWKAKKNGKVYYCPLKCMGKTTDPDGYAASLAWWRAQTLKIEKTPTPPSSFPTLNKDDRKEIQKLMDAPANPRTREAATLMIHRFNERAADPASEISEAGKWIYMDRERRTAQVPTDQTMEAMVKRFIGFKGAQALNGLKSAGRIINLRTYTDQFMAFVGPARPITDITAMTLLDFHTKTLNDMGTGKLSSSAARDRMQITKQFVRWAWELGVIDLPRNAESKELVISVEQQEIKIFKFETLKTILTGAPEPLQAYLLLMANCGMTSRDVADLLHVETDLQKGTISRVRSKRKKMLAARSKGAGASVKVTWKLWPLTLDLLLRHRNTKADTVFTTKDAGSLAYTRLDPKTLKGSDGDHIATAYTDYCETSEITAEDRMTLKCIRATSASKIGEHPEFGRFAQYFLGHSPRSVAERFYVKPSQDQFDQCVRWLGQQYGFVPKDAATA